MVGATNRKQLKELLKHDHTHMIDGELTVF